MLVHEFNLLSHNALNWGWDEIVDSTSVQGYTFYGLAQASSKGVFPLTSAGVWYISCLNNATSKTRYYPQDQIWDNRAMLTLP